MQCIDALPALEKARGGSSLNSNVVPKFFTIFYFPICRAEISITNLTGREAGNSFPYCPNSQGIKMALQLMRCS